MTEEAQEDHLLCVLTDALAPHRTVAVSTDSSRLFKFVVVILSRLTMYMRIQ
jgi:hypothetical protein